jgi:hypothetical protein
MTGLMRAKRFDDSPTSSGLAVGSPWPGTSWAKKNKIKKNIDLL